jgi:hypothetical protein
MGVRWWHWNLLGRAEPEFGRGGGGKATMRRYHLTFVKEAIEELDPAMKGREDESSYRTAIVLLASLELGPNVDALSRFTERLARLC